MDAKIWIEEARGSGGIKNWWVRIPGEPARCCGSVNKTTEAEAMEMAHRIATRARAQREAEEEIRLLYPDRQIYLSTPGMSPDVDWERAGISQGDFNNEYVFILKLRRSRGLEQIEKAVKL